MIGIWNADTMETYIFFIGGGGLGRFTLRNPKYELE